MKKILLFTCLPILALSLTNCGGDDDEPKKPQKPEQPSQPVTPPEPDSPDTPEWTLVWQDDFDAETIDESVWSRIPQGTPDWAKCQTTADCCYEKRKSSIVLKGIVNPDKSSDERDFLCGGLWTLGKKAFEPGRIEVKARMTSAQGAWPAIWMMPFKSTNGWPYDGEIDIMEHLNRDRTVYQTLHSGYIDVDGNRYNPLYSVQAPVSDATEYHVYAVDITAESIVMYVDGKATLTYPNIGVAGQYPFMQSWDLRIDMQLGGSWVGAVTASQLPVEMEVDWVKYYTKAD